MANKVINTILNRVSCRNYSDRKVPLSKVNQIVEAGKYAPSAMNRQICNILVVRSKRYVEALRKLSLETSNRDCLYGANTVCLVYAPKGDRFTYTDCSVILENMFIAATSLKVDCCWINQFDELLSTEEGLKLRKKLSIPEDKTIVGSVILGYRPEGHDIAVKARKEDIIRYL